MTRVIVVNKSQIGPVDPFVISSPSPDIAYQWVRTSLGGEPDLQSFKSRIENGWEVVAPELHPGRSVKYLTSAIESGDFILMQNSTEYVEGERAKDRAKSDAWIAAIRRDLREMGIEMEISQPQEDTTA